MARDRLFLGLAKKVGRAIEDFSLIEEGDKILVAISGGKDSFALADLLIDKQIRSPVKFELYFYHAAFSEETRAAVNGYAQRRSGITIMVDEEPLNNIRLDTLEKNRCFVCSWNRRKGIFTTAHRLGCKKVAFGHNLDDAAQTILMNMAYQSSISAMCPRQDFFGGILTVIRPLIYIREREIEAYVERRKYNCAPPCPYAEENKRESAKKAIECLQDGLRIDVAKNIFLSLNNIKYEYLPGFNLVHEDKKDLNMEGK